jgi:hypothetical protein
VGDLLAKVALGGLLHLGENHGRNLLGGESLLRAANLDLDDRLVILGDDPAPVLAGAQRIAMSNAPHILVGEVLDVLLDITLRELAANQALDVENGPEGVRRGLVLGGVSDQPLLIGEGDIRGGDTVSCEATVS